mmetsp:Transcript_45233/g.83929  ORF Transcript_45233/g.83929 Transcript_45233/m.83929 type:complete len:237 (-) Transcript_45233:712-1422(-)
MAGTSTSDANTQFPPRRSNPRRNPPIPANTSPNVNCLVAVVLTPLSLLLLPRLLKQLPPQLPPPLTRTSARVPAPSFAEDNNAAGVLVEEAERRSRPQSASWGRTPEKYSALDSITNSVRSVASLVIGNTGGGGGSGATDTVAGAPALARAVAVDVRGVVGVGNGGGDAVAEKKFSSGQGRGTIRNNPSAAHFIGLPWTPPRRSICCCRRGEAPAAAAAAAGCLVAAFVVGEVVAS